MRIWIDLANSPQVLFFRPILNKLKSAGHEIVLTTRAYAQTTQLADQLGLPHTVIGQHGGSGLVGLMRENFLRSISLVSWARSRKFALALSHNSYSQIMASSLLRIPSVTLMDYEHQPLNHLAFRLARRVIVPEAFPLEMLKKFGARHKAVIYPGVKEQVYLADFTPGLNFREKEGLPIDRPLVIVRPPAPWTAYHRFRNELFDELLGKIAGKSGHHVLFLPRSAEQKESVQPLTGLEIADRVYDGPNLLHSADLVISGGGTMNREAAVLGTPAYSVFKGKPSAVDQYLIEKGRMIQIRTVPDIGLIKIEKKNHNYDNLVHPALLQQVVDMLFVS